MYLAVVALVLRKLVPHCGRSDRFLVVHGHFPIFRPCLQRNVNILYSTCSHL